MNQASLFDEEPSGHPAWTGMMPEAKRQEMLNRLSDVCIKHQPQEWLDLVSEVGVALMTHFQHVRGPWLTEASRRLIKLRGLEDDNRYKPTTHNAWTSAIRVVIGRLGEPVGKVDTDTAHTHDGKVTLWQSNLYDKHRPKPDWWDAVMERGR